MTTPEENMDVSESTDPRRVQVIVDGVCYDTVTAKKPKGTTKRAKYVNVCESRKREFKRFIDRCFTVVPQLSDIYERQTSENGEESLRSTKDGNIVYHVKKDETILFSKQVLVTFLMNCFSHTDFSGFLALDYEGKNYGFRCFPDNLSMFKHIHYDNLPGQFKHNHGMMLQNWDNENCRDPLLKPWIKRIEAMWNDSKTPEKFVTDWNRMLTNFYSDLASRGEIEKNKDKLTPALLTFVETLPRKRSEDDTKTIDSFFVRVLQICEKRGKNKYPI